MKIMSINNSLAQKNRADVPVPSFHVKQQIRFRNARQYQCHPWSLSCVPRRCQSCRSRAGVSRMLQEIDSFMYSLDPSCDVACHASSTPSVLRIPCESLAYTQISPIILCTYHIIIFNVVLQSCCVYNSTYYRARLHQRLHCLHQRLVQLAWNCQTCCVVFA